MIEFHRAVDGARAPIAAQSMDTLQIEAVDIFQARPDSGIMKRLVLEKFLDDLCYGFSFDKKLAVFGMS